MKKRFTILTFISLGAMAACGDDRGDGGGDGNPSNNSGNPNNNSGNPNNNSGNSNNNTGNSNSSTFSPDTQLKDLTPAQVAALCHTTTQKNSDFNDPASNTGKAICLVESANDAYDDEDSDAENIEFCEIFLDECLQVPPYGPYNECMNPTDCTATAAEYEKCEADFLQALRDLITPFTTKTCSNLATKTGIDSVYDLFDAEVSIPSCEVLYTKCPNIDE